ncbi:hypothetical protein PN498_19575 [Oscillatoria sp. CS-180]|uniref:hypothetical protein n=1 Tax=Oscillatoria sp. CS-180 TaxID=3021720 RepID=UPI00232FFAE8|nr:hypothetical protein [Oscillatoria sp. CS-180]MDB9528202.1 hypothetical protein [Oscillatoria sp. CS-180]
MQQKNLYARLELLTPELEQTLKNRRFRPLRKRVDVRHLLGQLGQALLNFFVGSQEPRIIAKRDRNGYFLNYEVYDPVSRSRYVFDSEQELRVWLDQRYYIH